MSAKPPVAENKPGSSEGAKKPGSSSSKHRQEDSSPRPTTASTNQPVQHWLEALYDPMADLSSLTQCVSVDDLNGDGDYKLVIADLVKYRLRVYKGTNQDLTATLTDLPTAMVSVYMDSTEPRTPGLAIGSGSSVYIFKNFRPFFKIAVPPEQPNANERDLWLAAQRGEINSPQLMAALTELQREQHVRLSQQSLFFMNAAADKRAELFDDLTNKSSSSPGASRPGQALQLTQSSVTCLGVLNRSNPDEKSINVLVIGTEDGRLLVVECEAFSVLAAHRLPPDVVPVFIRCFGLFDVGYSFYVAARKPLVCLVRKRDTDASHSAATFSTITLPAPAVGFVTGIAEKQLVVACTDDALYEYPMATTPKKQVFASDRPEWRVSLPASPTCVAPIHHHGRNLLLTGVGLADGSVHLYNGRSLVSKIQLSDAPTALRFGRYGREDNTMIAITRTGALYVKILRRQANFDTPIAASSTASSVVSSSGGQLAIPKVSKLYLEQADRERTGSNAATSYRHLQRDLAAFRLRTARALATALGRTDFTTPVSIDTDLPLRLASRVTGLGPIFKLCVSLENTSLTTAVMNLHVVVFYNDALYSVRTPCLEAPFLCPGLVYELATFVERLDQRPIAEPIRVSVFRSTADKTGVLCPLLTAIINMPISEPTVG